MKGVQKLFVEWSFIPCVTNGWGYKDHSLFSGLLRTSQLPLMPATIQVHTYNHGDVLELQNGEAK